MKKPHLTNRKMPWSYFETRRSNIRLETDLRTRSLRSLPRPFSLERFAALNERT
jgi:hypothetical protein